MVNHRCAASRPLRLSIGLTMLTVRLFHYLQRAINRTYLNFAVICEPNLLVSYTVLNFPALIYLHNLFK